jgi:hypothetical protein
VPEGHASAGSFLNPRPRAYNFLSFYLGVF